MHYFDFRKVGMMDSCTVDLARLVARTIEKMMHAEGQTSIRLSDDCVRVLAETIAAVDAGRVKMRGCGTLPDRERRAGMVVPA